jgi:hypothetical protein
MMLSCVAYNIALTVLWNMMKLACFTCLFGLNIPTFASLVNCFFTEWWILILLNTFVFAKVVTSAEFLLD